MLGAGLSGVHSKRIASAVTPAGHVIPAVPPEKLRPTYDLILRRA